jgi:hypothetical protein
MELIALIGAIPFRFSGSTRGLLPDLALQLFPMPGPEPVCVVEEGDCAYLVVDHRAGSGPARIEWWSSTGEVEGGLAGLFVLADAPPGGHAFEFNSLASAAARIERSSRHHARWAPRYALRR